MKNTYIEQLAIQLLEDKKKDSIFPLSEEMIEEILAEINEDYQPPFIYPTFEDKDYNDEQFDEELSTYCRVRSIEDEL